MLIRVIVSSRSCNWSHLATYAVVAESVRSVLGINATPRADSPNRTPLNKRVAVRFDCFELCFGGGANLLPGRPSMLRPSARRPQHCDACAFLTFIRALGCGGLSPPFDRRGPRGRPTRQKIFGRKTIFHTFHLPSLSLYGAWRLAEKIGRRGDRRRTINTSRMEELFDGRLG